KPDNPQEDVTDPILTYADLTATGDPRNLETASIVYEKYIDKHLRQA
ncbi:MAG: type IV toxin-antitoxin system AbiEi family antitoxin, partial [Pseudomonadota bacterium]